MGITNELVTDQNNYVGMSVVPLLAHVLPRGRYTCLTTQPRGTVFRLALHICNIPSLMNDWILKLPTSARNKVCAKRTIQSSFYIFGCRAHSDQSSSHPSWISLPRLGPFTSTMVLSRGRVRLYGTLVLITLMPPAIQYSETAGAGFRRSVRYLLSPKLA